VILWFAPPAPAADDSPLAPFFGVYVGQAEVFEGNGDLREVRDLDVSIVPEKLGGFRVEGISVRLVDGRRDVGGVKRWMFDSRFERDKKGRLIESTRSSLFARKESVDLLSGAALRWAWVRDDVLSVYSMAILEDGRYELQIYDRRLTELGLDIFFRRLVDEELQTYAEGTTIRVETLTED
jgi:hypothetical protein